MAIWQLSKTSLKRLKRLSITLGILCFLYILPALLLYIPRIQAWTGSFLAEELSKVLNTPVRIERVALVGWRQLRLDGIQVLDSLGRPALSARSLRAGVYPVDIILEEEKELSSLRFFDLGVLVDVDSTTGRSNVQHILDALASDSDSPSSLRLGLNNILLRNARFQLLTNGQEQYSFDSIDLKLDRLAIRPDSIVGEINELKLKIGTGFRLNDLKAGFRFRGDSLHIRGLEAYLPHSYLNIPRAELWLSEVGSNILRELELKGLKLALKDVVSFYEPLVSWASDTLLMSTHIRRRGEGLEVQNLEASLTGRAYLRSRAQLQITPDAKIQAADVELERLILDNRAGSWLVERLGGQTVSQSLKNSLQSLGQVSYRGRAEMQDTQRFIVKGHLQTDLGAFDTDARLKLEYGQLRSLEANLGTDSFRLTPLLGKEFGQIQGEIHSALYFTPNSTYPHGKIQTTLQRLDWQKQEYRNIQAYLEGNEQGRYRLALNSGSLNFPLNLQGQFDLRGDKPQDIQLNVKAERFPLKQFIHGVDELSLDGELHASDLNLDNMMGDALFKDFRLVLGGKPLDLSHINIDMQAKRGEQTLRLSSPWMDMYLSGHYRPQTLLQDVLATLGHKLPILKGMLPPQNNHYTQAQLDLQIDSLPHSLKDLLHLPLEFRKRAQLKAEIDTRQARLDLGLNSPEVWLGQHRVQNFSLKLDDKQLQVGGDAYLYGGTQLIGAGLTLQAQENILRLSANLGQDSLGMKQGVVNLESELGSKQGGAKRLHDLNAFVRIAPSRLRVHTHIWDIAPATIACHSGGLQVAGLSLSTEGRHLAINGAVGNWIGEDALRVQLYNINLRYILEAAGVYFDLLDTDLTGQIDARLEGKHLVAKAAVRSPHFYVNKQDVGAIDIGLNFSTQDLLINLSGNVEQAHGGGSRVEGWIKPADGSGIDLKFEAQRLNVAFVGSFMDGFLTHLGGYGTGQARLHGLFERGVTVAGDAHIEEGRVGVRALGTEYSFDHHLLLEDERIHLDGIKVYDDEGHSAVLRGYVDHQYFDNFDIQLRAEDMQGIKVLNTLSPRLMPAYGKAYATGTAKMQGTGNKLKITIDVQSETGTDITLDFDTMTAGKDESLMRFVRLRPDTLGLSDSVYLVPPSSAIIDLVLKVQITPAARLALKMGEDKSSMLRGQAQGVLNINAPSVGNPEVYGTLAVVDGEYLFNLQQLALKSFILKEGGSLAFRGDAMRASLNNLNAVYVLTANISDLDESISKHSQRTNIPVHCLLNLSGEVSKPQITFDIELPGVDAELERRVRSLLNTPDAVTRQMLYLIALGKFHTSDATTRSTSTTNNWTSVASSALSEQLTSLLGGLSEHIKLGTSIKTKTTAFEDTDIELNFSSAFLGNRLLINGNVGYHDNPYLNGQYLGEFEFEYKLNRSGTFRFKGYNRYNTMYQYLRQSFLTQGLGILYRQRFDKLSDLFRSARSTPLTSVDSLATLTDSVATP